MNIDFVLPASPIPCDLPPESAAGTNPNADNVSFTAALEAETLKLMAAAPALALPTGRVAAEASANVVDTGAWGASLVSTGIVQFLIPDSESPKIHKTSPDLDASQTAATLPSLLGLVWNDSPGKILPSAENSAGKPEPEQQEPRLVRTTQVATEPQPLFVDHNVATIQETALPEPASNTEQPADLKVPPPTFAISENSEKEAVSNVLERTSKTSEPSETPVLKRESLSEEPIQLDSPIPKPQHVERNSVEKDSVEKDSKVVHLAPVPEEFEAATTVRPADSQQPVSERPSPEDTVEHSPAPMTPEQQQLIPEARIAAVEGTKVEAPPRQERAAAPREKPETTELVAEPVLTTVPDPITTISADSENHYQETRKPVARESKVVSGEKVQISRESEPLPQPPTAPIRSETNGIDKHESLGPAVVPHSTKHPAVETVKPIEALGSDQTTQWTQIERTDVVSQLVEKARSLRFDRPNEIVVSLKPESLGRISMRASLVDRTMVATISAESERVRQLLQLELPAIQRSLQETGVIARVAVTEQADLHFGNSLSHGQPRFRQQPETLPFREELISQNPAATTEVADTRYTTHSVHFIA
jgi:hypothetical protein